MDLIFPQANSKISRSHHWGLRIRQTQSAVEHMMLGFLPYVFILNFSYIPLQQFSSTIITQSFTIVTSLCHSLQFTPPCSGLNSFIVLANSAAETDSLCLDHQNRC